MGLQHICQNLKIFGNEVNGSFAEYVAVPETSLWRLAPTMSWDIGAIMEPLGGAVQAVLMEPVTAQSVVIYGDGPIALFAAGVARRLGAQGLPGRHGAQSAWRSPSRWAPTSVFNISDPIDPVQAIIQDETRGRAPTWSSRWRGAGIHQERLRHGAQGRPGDDLRPDAPSRSSSTSTTPSRCGRVTVRGVAGRHMWDTWRLVDGLLAVGAARSAPGDHA